MKNRLLLLLTILCFSLAINAQKKNDKNKNDGYTALYLLSESHLTFHSFVDAKCLSINLYTSLLIRY